MPRNQFFHFFDYGPTQELYQDLITQAIEIYGIDVIYLKRNLVNFDQLYLTDDQSSYTIPIYTTVYLQSYDGFGPEQNIFTKFGLEIRDNITVSMSTRIWETEVQPITGTPRPDEGDLIFFVLNKKCFQIKYTNNKEIFYQLGKLPTYQMTCELFEYSDETFNTGVPEIDVIQSNFSLNILDNVITNESEQIITFEDGGQMLDEKFDVQNINPTYDNDELGLNSVNLIDNTSSPNPIAQVDTKERQ